MNEPKHTPGPWKITGMRITTDVPTPGFLATICDTGERYREPYPNNEPNAHLIVAAPGMLTELKNNLAHMKRIEQSNESCNMPFDEDNAERIAATELIIAKAEGRTW